jgi:hypothetical protein
MSINTYDSALDFLPAAAPGLIDRAVRGFRLFADAMADGQAANLRYTELKAHGVSHETATRILMEEHFGAR